MSVTWSDELAADVHKHYQVGGLSAAQTARKLGQGLTPSSVIGGATRRWGKKGEGQAGGVAKANVKTEYRAPSAAPVEESHTARRFGAKYPATEKAKLIADLGAHDCKWPVGVPEQAMDQLFCAERATEGVYCPKHRGKAYQKATPCES